MSGWLAIVNPRSGGSGMRGRLPRILEKLGRVTDKTVCTEYPGHAAELALGATGYSGLAAVGGDGTLFEILKGLDRNSQRIAIIPAGRGNSLARDLGLFSRRPRFDVINSDEPRYIDLLEVTFADAEGLERKNVSASTIALGYPAAVTKAARKFPWLGKFCYAAAAASVRPAAFTVEISCEGGAIRERRVTGFVANNTRHMANFVAFPGASCTDGVFDLMELNAGFSMQNAHNLSALCGSHFYRPCGTARMGSVRVRLDQPQELMIDGESYADIVAVSIRILPAALACNARQRAG